MVKRSGADHYVPVSWEEAYELIAQELNGLKSPARPRSIRPAGVVTRRRLCISCSRERTGPDDDKLAAQLGSIKWGIDSRGRIKIESKDDMRKRGLPSPDRADAMAIAFAGRANAAPMNVESHAGESITGDLMTKAW